MLVAVGEGRKDERTGRMSGRARDGRLVHFATGAPGAVGEAATIRPGDIVHTTITYAAPHHLNADGAPLAHRRTRAGDAAEAGRTPRTPGVLLGLPTVGAPAGAAAADRRLRGELTRETGSDRSRACRSPQAGTSRQRALAGRRGRAQRAGACTAQTKKGSGTSVETDVPEPFSSYRSGGAFGELEELPLGVERLLGVA